MGSARFNGDGNGLVLGPSGSGKGTCFAVPNLIEWRGPAYVLDPKGELTAITIKARAKRRRVIVINPWGLHTGAPWNLPQDKWNVLDELDPASPTFRDDCDLIASLIVAQALTDGGNTAYFKAEARQKLGRGYIAFAKTYEPPERQNLITVHEYVNLSGDAEIALWEVMKSSNVEFIATEAADFDAMAEDAPQQFTAVKSTMREATNWLGSEAMRETLCTSTFSFTDLKGCNE